MLSRSCQVYRTANLHHAVFRLIGWHYLKALPAFLDQLSVYMYSSVCMKYRSMRGHLGWDHGSVCDRPLTFLAQLLTPIAEVDLDYSSTPIQKCQLNKHSYCKSLRETGSGVWLCVYISSTCLSVIVVHTIQLLQVSCL